MLTQFPTQSNLHMVIIASLQEYKSLSPARVLQWLPRVLGINAKSSVWPIGPLAASPGCHPRCQSQGPRTSPLATGNPFPLGALSLSLSMRILTCPSLLRLDGPTSYRASLTPHLARPSHTHTLDITAPIRSSKSFSCNSLTHLPLAIGFPSRMEAPGEGLVCLVHHCVPSTLSTELSTQQH